MSLAPHRPWISWSAAASLAALTACGGTTEVAQPPAKDVTPASITAVSTDTVRGVVGAQGSLPLAVIVKNKAGEPLDTTTVTFAIVSGNGTVGSPSVKTNSTGQASTTWALGGTVGLQTATATVGNLAPVTFRAVATVGAPSNLTKVAGDAQSAAINANVAIAPSVKVTDRFGNPIAGQVVTFAVGSGGGSVNGGTVNSGADGSATVTSWRLGSAVGANSLVATAGTLTATFTATATVGAPAAITVTPTTLGEMLVGDVSQITPRVVDAGGNVLSNSTVTYSTSSPGIATVSSSGAVTAVGAGTATITAAAGTVSASVPVTVIGHPAGTTISQTIALNFIAPGDVAFTNNAMLIALGGQNQVMIRDATGATQTGIVTVPTTAQTLLAPARAAGPAVLVASGIPSRLYFIDPTLATLTDSLTLTGVITASAIRTDGTRIYAMLDDGHLSVVDGGTHQEITRVSLGGGVTKIRVAPGDTTLYALTTVGVVFDVDLKTNTVRRQIISSFSSTDFVIGRDGYFYLLDATNSLVRIFDVNTSTVLRAVGVTSGATTIAVSPDVKQIWLTHSLGQITIYQGSLATGFLSAGSISTNGSPPLRTFLSPSGSFAAVTNLGGWVDIIR
jgi:hypothetical protein